MDVLATLPNQLSKGFVCVNDVVILQIDFCDTDTCLIEDGEQQSRIGIDIPFRKIPCPGAYIRALLGWLASLHIDAATPSVDRSRNDELALRTLVRSPNQDIQNQTHHQRRHCPHCGT